MASQVASPPELSGLSGFSSSGQQSSAASHACQCSNSCESIGMSYVPLGFDPMQKSSSKDHPRR
eukprot:4667827-Heterocapsa_arctica.AAC.1